jgi:heparan-alpha-glucosaminide N-acetyltransferase
MEFVQLTPAELTRPRPTPVDRSRTAPTRAPDVVPDAAPAPPPPARRLASLDVFRGVTMLFMATEMLGIPWVMQKLPGSGVARFLAVTLDHVPWTGVVPWDLIQPSFMFMVGVALPFSVASRRAAGQPFAGQLGHAARRALILVLLGIFLRSQTHPQTYFTFEDVLTQIGLGYVFLFLLAHARPRTQWAAALAILAAYWAAFALYPLPPAGFDTAAVGVPADWPHHLTGFAAHWDMNTNLASRADQWFLNLFPRERPFVYNKGGYTTLSFVPSLATMIFGLLAGEQLRVGGADRAADRDKVRKLVLYGAAGVALGTALHVLGVCPIVKRIWTPSWAVFSAGWAALFLALFYHAVDVRGQRRWAFPFLVVGTNSIAMYVLVNAGEKYTEKALHIHLGRRAFEALGKVYEPILTGAAALLVFWLILRWMYRRRIFIRI